jgi:hypothetical protein
MEGSALDRRSVRARLRHRRKSGPFPLGATRFRVIQALSGLGLYANRIAARMRAEQRAARLLEAQRLAHFLEAWRAAARLEAQRLTAAREEERAELLVVQRRFIRLLEEELAFQSMTDEQKAVERLEEQIVAWVSGVE